MEKLVKELRQAILVWIPSPDDEKIFWELNQLLISIRDKIPPELALSLEGFTYLQVMLRHPKGTPKKEFERQLNQLLHPRRFVWEVKEHHELFEMWFREQTGQSLEVKRVILDVVCDALSFIRENLPEITPNMVPVLDQSLKKINERKWKGRGNKETEEWSLF